MSFEDRHMIEALRSGVPSRSVGAFFTGAREGQLNIFRKLISDVAESGVSNAKIFTGRYGEGKSHMLNTLRSVAEENNMVVSMLSFGSETPAGNLPLIYRKLIEQTWLPGAVQPGFMTELFRITAGSEKAQSLLAYAKNELDSDKLYYIFKAMLNVKNEEHQYLLQDDISGRFINLTQLKSIFNACVEDEKFTGLERKFLKTKNTMDYFRFMAMLFCVMGYKGWVILFDEAELIGSLQIKSRFKAYENFMNFLHPAEDLEAVFSAFAFSSAYNQDVIVGKDELLYLQNWDATEDRKQTVRTVIGDIANAMELRELTKDELSDCITQIIGIYRKAYNFYDQLDTAKLATMASSTGYLLRTRIRAAIEYLDQVQLYGTFSPVTTTEVDSGDIKEEVPEDPDLEKLLEDF